MTRFRHRNSRGALVVCGLTAFQPASAQVSNACQNPPVTCESLPAGFSVTLQSFTQDQDAGASVY